MAYYSFNIKKGKYQVEMISDDKYFARKQVGKLFESLIKVRGKLKVVLPPVPKETEEPKKEKGTEKESKINEPAPKSVIVEEKPIKEKEVKETKKVEAKRVEEIIEKKLPEPEPVKPEPTNVEVVEDVEEISVVEEEEIEELPEEATVEETPTEESEEVIKINDEVVDKEKVQNLFENILAEKTSEIEETAEEEIIVEEPEEKPAEPNPPAKRSFSFKKIITDKFKASEDESPQQKLAFREPEVIAKTEEVSKEDDITRVLEEKIKSGLPQKNEEQAIVTEVIEEIEENYTGFPDFDSLEELISIKQPQSKLEYLLLTAYYLQTKENLFKYSLKQINSKIMPFLGELIDHSIIHNAVGHDFIEVVPDYNETSDVTEYKLTAEGEEYILNN